MIEADSELEKEMAELGVNTALSCFNCVSCSAVCPLGLDSFPRRFIRYVQLGAREKIIENSGDLWRCLHCGLCTAVCPRQAKPGEIIQGLKRLTLPYRRKK